MNIFLLGYMASGKSTVGKLLASKLKFGFLDLDAYIETKEAMDIPTIFSKKGEIYFRKQEAKYLNEVLALNNPTVVALGGGTPCYGDNMKVLTQHQNTKTIYLKMSIEQLSKRLLQEKDTRPLIAHLKSDGELNEFIGKHLFERQYYYNQASIILDVNGNSVQEIVEKIVLNLV